MLESTYGDRLHTVSTDDEKEQEFAEILREGIARGGNIVIPAFAVGRTQELLYYIKRFLVNGTVPGLEKVPVYIDSPLGIKATRIYAGCGADCYDDETKALARSGDLFEFDSLHIAETVEQSMEINDLEGCNIIISASGMCEAGRIRHHLKNNLYKANATVVFVGYQAVGTLGRIIIDGAKKVKILGVQVIINAAIKQIEGFSGHADQSELLEWVSEIPETPKKIFLVHGEDKAINALKGKLQEKGYSIEVPEMFEEFDLGTGEVYATATKKVTEAAKQRRQQAADIRASLKRLIFAATELLSAEPDRAKDMEEDIGGLADRMEKLVK